MARALKQVVYGAFYLSIVFGIGYILFFRVIVPPSCSDGFKNQGETGIDCGGPCYSCEIKSLSQPSVTQVIYFVNTNERTVDLAARIRNPNLNWGIKNFEYEFILKDADNKEIAKIPGTDFLLPAETRWIIRPGGGGEFPLISVSRAALIRDVEFVLKPILPGEWQKLKPFAQQVSIIAKNVNFRKIKPPEIGFAELRGEVVNRSSFYLDEIYVGGILFSGSDDAIAVGKTLVKTLRPGESRFFSIKWPAPFSGTVARFDAFGYSNLFLDINFLKQFGDAPQF